MLTLFQVDQLKSISVLGFCFNLGLLVIFLSVADVI